MQPQGDLKKASRDLEKCSLAACQMPAAVGNALMRYFVVEASLSAAPEQMLISVFGHPFGTGQVALPGAASPLGFVGRIDLKHNAGHLPPVGTFGLCVQEPKVGGKMLPIVIGQLIVLRGLVSDMRFGS
jgi:hypothetical protein